MEQRNGIPDNRSFDEVIPNVLMADNSAGETTDIPRLPGSTDTPGFHLAEEFIGEAGMKRMVAGSGESHRPAPDRNYIGRHHIS